MTNNQTPETREAKPARTCGERRQPSTALPPSERSIDNRAQAAPLVVAHFNPIQQTGWHLSEIEASPSLFDWAELA